MSTITNDPILLDETGMMMLEAIEQENALLSMIAEGRRHEMYSDISQIANIVRGNSVEANKKLFPIGDQIVIPWKDMDRSNHNTDETAYQVPLDIVTHREVELETGEKVPGMFLQWHYATPYGVQFGNVQAFLNCKDGLVAGTYYITFGDSFGNHVQANASWSFTLTKDVPAGGRLSGFENMNVNAFSPENWKVKNWADPGDAEPQETVSVVSGANGTYLGAMNSDLGNDSELNTIERVCFGHNRYKTSAIRQYLNKSGSNWWTTQEDFDIRPNEYAKNGFMTGFNEDFLSAIKPVKVTTALNTVEGFTDATEDTFDTFFLPSLEEMNGTPQLATVEGPYFEYWRRRLGLNGFASVSPSIYDGYKIYGIDAQDTPKFARLRSAVRDNTNNSWTVASNGRLYFNSYAALTFTPVCVIC